MPFRPTSLPSVRRSATRGLADLEFSKDAAHDQLACAVSRGLLQSRARRRVGGALRACGLRTRATLEQRSCGQSHLGEQGRAALNQLASDAE